MSATLAAKQPDKFNLPAPITAYDEVELHQNLKQETLLKPFHHNSPLPHAQTENSTHTHQKSSESAHSSSPGLNKASKMSRMGGADMNYIMRRRQRLSTISSELNDIEYNESPKQSFKRRRKSSNFDMLCDPIKYQDYVNKFLDDIDEQEEEERKLQGRSSQRKRTRSSTYFKQPMQNALPEINEEQYDQEKTQLPPKKEQAPQLSQDKHKSMAVANNPTTNKNTDFIKD